MKIGILVLMINNFGKKGFYNSQEVGMAKAIAKRGHKVVIYKLVEKKQEKSKVSINNNIIFKTIPVRNYGNNGDVNISELNPQIEKLICFSDTQVFLPRVYHWCKKYSVEMIPYIGVVESHSNNAIIRGIINTLFFRNIQIYRKCRNFVKSPQVKAALEKRGVQEVQVVPVGLDLDLMNEDYKQSDIGILKRKLGLADKHRIILFVGRMEDEKRPLDMINYFKKISEQDDHYRLMIIGDGYLKDKIMALIKKLNLSDRCIHKQSVPNNEMWQYYRISECMVNLNRQEIFGMVLLEAMYYECPVVAWTAPGPDYILEDKRAGFVVKNDDELIKCIFDPGLSLVGENERQRVLSQFTWERMADAVVGTK